MKNVDKFYINGEWITPKSTNEMPVINPANEEEIAIEMFSNNIITADERVAVE